jgi:uncharacterized protein YifE (UPF0438 family)
MLPRDHYLKQSFHDAVNFPAGFEKGGLSDIQARLIRKHGALISALTRDEVSDPSADDLHLLKVIASQSAPKNPVEQAWIKYLSIVKSRQTDVPKAKAKPKAAASKAALVVEETTPDTTSAAEVKATPAPKAKAVKAVKTEKSEKVVPVEAPAKPAAKKTAAPKKANTAKTADTIGEEKSPKVTRKKPEPESAAPSKPKAAKKNQSCCQLIIKKGH